MRRVTPQGAAIVAAGLVLLLLTARSLAQTDNGATVSTKSGVYTAAQADRGEELYMGLCVSCHPIAMHSGQTFTVRWGGRPLFELYEAIKEKMPKTDPGTLTPEESAQLIAYVLRLNDVAAGKTALEPEVEKLKGIRIETPLMADK
jgi:mono/diheme cytochrome c family protein